MKVTPITGEQTRFFVEGNTLVCEVCNKAANPTKKRAFAIGDHCLKVSCEGLLKTREHLVDIVSYSLNGACSCEHFDYNLRKTVESMSLLQRREAPLRCDHIKAARDFCLDRQLAEYIKTQTGGRPVEKENE